MMEVDFDSTDEDQRRWAIIEASQNADLDALPRLLELLQTESEDNRRHVVRAMGNIGGAICEEQLLAMLKNETGIILGDIARSLGSLKSIEAISPLTTLLSHEIDWVCESARWALKQIPDK